jgi:enamine deaminase RidA (YjgF/YER057c/UK114 family)
MRPELISPDGLFPEAPYAYVAVAPPGSLVFAAGACPLTPEGTVVSPGDVEEQTRVAVANLIAALQAADSSWDQVLKTTIYVRSDDQADLVRAWRVYETAVGEARPPSTLLGVSALGYTHQLVEIEAVALKPAP